MINKIIVKHEEIMKIKIAKKSKIHLEKIKTKINKQNSILKVTYLNKIKKKVQNRILIIKIKIVNSDNRNHRIINIIIKEEIRDLNKIIRKTVIINKETMMNNNFKIEKIDPTIMILITISKEIIQVIIKIIDTKEIIEKIKMITRINNKIINNKNHEEIIKIKIKKILGTTTKVILINKKIIDKKTIKTIHNHKVGIIKIISQHLNDKTTNLNKIRTKSQLMPKLMINN